MVKQTKKRQRSKTNWEKLFVVHISGNNLLIVSRVPIGQ